MTFPILLQKLFDEGGGGNKLRQDIIPPVKSKTTSELNNFTGAAGEITFDTTAKRLVAHDGTTKGGIPVATKQEVEQVANSLDPRILDAASQADILEAVGQVTGGSVSQSTLEGLQASISTIESNKLSDTDKKKIIAWGLPDYSSRIALTTPSKTSVTYAATYQCMVELRMWSMSGVPASYSVNGLACDLGSSTTNNQQTPSTAYVFLESGDRLVYVSGYNDTGTERNYAYVYPLKGAN